MSRRLFDSPFRPFAREVPVVVDGDTVWERLADTLLGPIVVDVSPWIRANPHDSPPAGGLPPS